MILLPSQLLLLLCKNYSPTIARFYVESGIETTSSYQIIMITTKRIGISIPIETFEDIEGLRTRSNRSQFILELIRPELEKRVNNG